MPTMPQLQLGLSRSRRLFMWNGCVLYEEEDCVRRYEFYRNGHDVGCHSIRLHYE